MRRDLIVGMAGAGGDGVISAGESLITAALLEGYYGILTKSFGSQIRGGESSCRVRISSSRILTGAGILDVAVALNWEDFLKFGSELTVGERSVVIYDSKTGISPSEAPVVESRPAEIVAVPIAELARQAGAEKAKSTIVLGLLAQWFGIAREGILSGLRKKFGRKSSDVLAANEKAFAAGLAYAEAHPLRARVELAPPSAADGKRLLADGNEMCAAASLFAGCEFFSGYPITPSSEIMHFLSREIWQYGGTMLQAEDEIAGVGAAVGASFAGKKALTATSGPGMSLKTEMLGLASIAELPLVCVNVQRGGPATGLPTKSEQADLFQAAFSAHGDVIRPLLAPTDVGDIFGITVEAFNIAEEYQTPVIILSDQEIGQRKEILDPIKVEELSVSERRAPSPSQLEHYQRFQCTESGISPLSHPGMPGGAYLASGIEHDEAGAPTVSGQVHARMTEKRLRKLDPLKGRTDLFAIEGDADAPLALVSWGSIAGVAREALQAAHAEGIGAKLLIPKLLYPVAEEVYRQFFASVRAGLVVEQSHQGQLHRLIRMFVDVPSGMRTYCKSSANPILATEIVEELRPLWRSLNERQPARSSGEEWSRDQVEHRLWRWKSDPF